MIKTHIQSLILGICLLLPFAVQAGCYFQPSGLDVAFDPANVVIGNKAVGETLATITVSYSVNCPNANELSPTETWVLYPMSYSSSLAPSSVVADVHETGYAGIGIRWYSSVTGQAEVARTTSAIDSTQLVIPRAGGSIDERFELVKTGPVSSAGQLPAMSFLISYKGSEHYNQGGPIYVTQRITLSRPIIQLASCTVTGSAINVNMGTISTSAFSGMGSTASSTQFRIPVVCDGNTPLSFTIDDSYTSSDPQNGLLTLGNGSTASGVAIQVLYQDVPLRLSLAQSLGTVSNGSFDIALTARYYQIGSTVTPGAANATATITFTYN